MPQITNGTAPERLEINVAQYIQGRLSASNYSGWSVIHANSRAYREGDKVIEIDAHSDASEVEMGAALRANMVVAIAANAEAVNASEASNVANLVLSSLVETPRLTARPLRGAATMFAAINKRVGTNDTRSAGLIHVWDIHSPSMSLAGQDASPASVVTAVVDFVGDDWPGASNYAA